MAERQSQPRTDGRRTCGAQTRSGGRCKGLAMAGQDRCRMHGGSSPQAKRKAEQRLVEQTARATLADLDHTEPVTDPFAALEDLAGQAKRFADILRTKVGELTQVGYSSSQGLEQVKAEIQVYLSALTRAESVLAKIVSLDLESRRVRIAEAQASLVAAALARVLASSRLGLDNDAQRWARAALAKELGAPVTAIQATTT